MSQFDTEQAGDTPASVDVDSVDQIDLFCDEFEKAWLNGESPQIEVFLEQCEGATRHRLLAELLLVDRELRVRQGETASRFDYLRRFPQYSTVVDDLEFPTIDERSGKRPFERDGTPVPLAGARLGQFELVAELGSGASGTVWKAKDSRLRRTVAIKIPRYGSLTDNERERFMREGQACAQLQHPNIVAVYEVGEDRGQLFIVAEFIEGLNLKDWLQQRPPKSREAAELAAQLAEALHHAHEQGVIHRDLKPANVLMDREGRPHITDFGLAKWSADTALMTVEGNILGTPAYMSPEQARGNAAHVDRRSDVYGLGALLYEMLTDQPPFRGDVATIVHKVIHDEPQPPRSVASSVPRDLETICLKAMEKEPNRRYPSTQEMAVDLRRFQCGEPILARRTSQLEKSWRWLRRHPALAASLLLSVIAASAFGMVGMLAHEKQHLLGLRTVAIATEPPGARIAFVPIDELTGELQVSRAVFVPNESPSSVVLPHGDFYVVAILPNGQFHEVFRHVPARSEPLPGSFRHQRWRILASGDVELPKIEIPHPEVSRGMALFDGSNSFQMGKEGVPSLPIHKRRVAPFYADSTEFTMEDCRRALGEVPRRFTEHVVRDELALAVSFDDAVAIAERVGKRLPSEAEYELMATSSGRVKHSWGNSLPRDASTSTMEFGRAGTPSFDRLPTNPPVFGLCTNVAEWTYSFAVPYPPRAAVARAALKGDYRIVRGGDFNTVAGDPGVTIESRDPRLRLSVPRYVCQRGLGFRCVRSFRPMISFDNASP